MAVTARSPFSLGGESARRSERDIGKTRGAELIVTSKGCSSVRPRKGTPRLIEPDNLTRLVESLAQGHQLPPIGIASDGTLVYGAHRLAAAQVLATTPDDRKKALGKLALAEPLTDELLNRILKPPRRQEVLLRQDLSEDWEAELRENTQRRQISPTLVKEQLDVLIEHGFETAQGRPRKGAAPPAIPRLAKLWGVDVKTIHWHLAKLKEPTDAAKQKPKEKLPPSPQRARTTLCSQLSGFTKQYKGQRTREAKQILSLVSQLTELLETAAKKKQG